MPRKKIKRTRAASKRRIKAPAVTSISSDAVKPIFSLRHLDKNFSLTKCTKEEKAAFADTLYKLSQLSWQELRQAPRRRLRLSMVWVMRESQEMPFGEPFQAILPKKSASLLFVFMVKPLLLAIVMVRFIISYGLIVNLSCMPTIKANQSMQRYLVTLA